MIVDLSNAGRRFNQEWIFRNVNLQLVKGQKYAILGPNGSGKSTFLSLLLGNLSPSEGTISYREDKVIHGDDIYKYVSFAAPYLDLIEEFTLEETVAFHFQFKRLHAGMGLHDVLDRLGLVKAQDKALKYFSSGMKQRTKLVLACCADTPMLLLDEPTSNLDAQGLSWYRELIKDFTENRLLVIGSNQEAEYDFCDQMVKITDYK